MATKTSLSSLAPSWLEPAEKTLQHVFATKEAELAFAQVIDGLPTAPAAFRMSADDMRSDIINRAEPSAAALSAFRHFTEEFNIIDVQLSSQTLQRYQDTQLGSLEFKLRLLGLVAVAIHDLAVETFAALHPEGGPSHSSKVPWHGHIFKPDLYHPNYMCWQQYPRGLLELVGYWVEAEIFGGTIVFEHDSNEEGIRSIFIHPFFRKLFKLSPGQVDEFANLATTSLPSPEPTGALNSDHRDSYPTPTKNIVPFSPEPQAEAIVDDIGIYPFIYRDKYERVPKIREPGPGCVRRGEVTEQMRQFAEQVQRQRSS